ncbi:MAG: transglycosylase family protein [Tetrasphaera sp.]|nr:transglycosylase family protein [Tetrasphaera sp.]
MAYAAKHRRARSASVVARTARAVMTTAAGVAVVLVPAVAHADSVWDKVAMCESSGNWSINTGNGYYGGLQFSQPTWVGFGGQSFAAYAHQASKNEQIYTAQQVLKVQGPGAWPVCSVKAGLTVANGLAYDTGITPPGSGGGGSGDIDVDGELGPQTYSAMEKWLKQPVNGVFGTTDKKALQAKLKVPVTGSINTTTVKALQKLVGAYVDGDWGPQTTTKLQIFLNKVL